MIILPKSLYSFVFFGHPTWCTVPVCLKKWRTKLTCWKKSLKPSKWSGRAGGPSAHFQSKFRTSSLSPFPAQRPVKSARRRQRSSTLSACFPNYGPCLFPGRPTSNRDGRCVIKSPPLWAPKNATGCKWKLEYFWNFVLGDAIILKVFWHIYLFQELLSRLLQSNEKPQRSAKGMILLSKIMWGLNAQMTTLASKWREKERNVHPWQQSTNSARAPTIKFHNNTKFAVSYKINTSEPWPHWLWMIKTQNLWYHVNTLSLICINADCCWTLTLRENVYFCEVSWWRNR